MKKNSIIFLLIFSTLLRLTGQVNFQNIQNWYNEGKYQLIIENLTGENTAQANMWTLKAQFNLISNNQLSFGQRNDMFSSMMILFDGINKKYDNVFDSLAGRAVMDLQNSATYLHNINKPVSSYSAFQMAFTLSENLGQKDTALAYMVGSLALKQGDMGNAVYYLEKAIAYGMNQPKVYIALIDFYKQMDDEKKLAELLNITKNKFEKNRALLNEEINFYLSKEKLSEAKNRLIQLKLTLPDDENLLFILASLFQNFGEIEMSEKTFKQVLHFDSLNYQALIGAGALSLDQAVTKQNWQSVPDPYLLKAKVYLEKAYGAYPEDHQVLQLLSQVYSLLGSKEDFESVNKKLGQQ